MSAQQECWERREAKANVLSPSRMEVGKTGKLVEKREEEGESHPEACLSHVKGTRWEGMSVGVIRGKAEQVW